MRTARLAAAALLALGLAPAAAPQAAPAADAPKALTLRECIVRALRDNPGLAAEVIAPGMADLWVRQAGEVFLPRLSFAAGLQDTNQASFSWINAADSVATRYGNYGVSWRQLLPTGGTVVIGLDAYSTDTTQSFLTINPRYGSELSFRVTQPLLRGFGPTASRRDILVARNERDVSESRYRQVLLDLVTGVEEAYWNLVFARQDLEVRTDSLSLARDLLAKNESELAVGVIPRIDILNARSEVAAREADILQAEAAVRTAEDTLLARLGTPPGGRGAERIVPADRPGEEPRDIDAEEALRLALANRPDLDEARTTLRSRGVDLAVARNGLLPDVSLNASYWSPGVSGTRILYQDDNPLTGVVVGRVPGKASLAFQDAMKFKYRNWSVDVTFELPLDTAFSRARYSRARLDERRSELRLKDLETSVRLEVETARRAVETDYKRILAYRAARVLQEETLKGEELKLRSGLSTSYVVLQHQRDLARARGEELRAVIDYNVSQARFERAVGTTLETKGIGVAELPGR